MCITRVIGQKKRCTLTRSPVCYRIKDGQSCILTFSYYFRWPINLACFSRKPGYSGKKTCMPMNIKHTKREHATSTKDIPTWESNLQISCCEATVLTIIAPTREPTLKLNAFKKPELLQLFEYFQTE